MSKCMLTTIDNPYNPFKQFDEWFAFDVEKQYYSCSRLARLTNICDEMCETEVEQEIERAIDKLIEIDVLNIYKKLTLNEETNIKTNNNITDQ